MYLTRNHQEKCVAARVMRGARLHQEYFTLKQYGSWEKAERAGRRWLQDLLPSLPPKGTGRGRMTGRNHSGIVGVYRTPGVIRRRDGRQYSCPRWVARWPGCKFTGGLSWSVRQYEDEGAFVLAALARRLESVDRDRLLDEFAAIFGTSQYLQILALKKI